MTTSCARRSVPLIINAAVMAACLFGSAGRLDWKNGWTLIVLSCLTGVVAEFVVSRSPGLARERSDVKGGESWDKAIVPFVVLLGPAATWITAGLDNRHGWSTSLSPWVRGAGVFAAVVGGAVLVWAMRSNAYFSAVVRIQKDRGQTVVRSGPYRVVRHPGYAGMSLFMLATPLILGSRWAMLPAVATVVVTVIRTALEDRTLQRELEGYAEYAGTVRFKLVPLVW